MPGIDSAAKERIRSMIAKNRGISAKMAEQIRTLGKKCGLGGFSIKYTLQKIDTMI